jgi:para-nitrobenzyl esterase
MKNFPRISSFIILCVLGAFTLFMGGCGGSDDAGSPTSPIVKNTQFGTVEGLVIQDGQTYAWLGIPFAKPPVANLRWKAPADPAPWTGNLKAQQFGNACSQLGSLYGPPPAGMDYGLANVDTINEPIGNEDCLNLNIWRPATDEKNLPVLVFIHGGSWKTGSGIMYNGATLANKANAVVVTTNYRVGMFGWLNHPAIKTGNPLDDSGNFGTLDLITALKFVKNNIANFGGDPANITTMGQSAGAGNIYSLIVSPLTKDLLHKAIPMSLGLTTSLPATGTTYATTLLQQLLIKDGLATDTATANAYLALRSNDWIRGYLYSKSTTDLMGLTTITALGSPPNNFSEGTVIPADPTAAINNGDFRNVPLIIGNTSEEGKLFAAYVGAWKVTDQVRLTLMATFNPDAAVQTLKTSDLITMSDAAFITATAGLNSIIMASIDKTTPLMKSKQDNVYAYSFNWSQQPYPWNIIYGATHAQDISFMFGTFDKPSLFSSGYSTANKPGREALSNAMINSVKSFIRTGDPNNSALGTTWEKWSPTVGGPKKLIFDADKTTAKISMSSY